VNKGYRVLPCGARKRDAVPWPAILVWLLGMDDRRMLLLSILYRFEVLSGEEVAPHVLHSALHAGLGPRRQLHLIPTIGIAASG
jgi:hypothetical protein